MRAANFLDGEPRVFNASNTSAMWSEHPRKTPPDRSDQVYSHSTRAGAALQFIECTQLQQRRSAMKVKDVMHKGVDWVGSDTPVLEIAKLMREHDIGAIPIGEK